MSEAVSSKQLEDPKFVQGENYHCTVLKIETHPSRPRLAHLYLIPGPICGDRFIYAAYVTGGYCTILPAVLPRGWQIFFGTAVWYSVYMPTDLLKFVRMALCRTLVLEHLGLPLSAALHCFLFDLDVCKRDFEYLVATGFSGEVSSSTPFFRSWSCGEHGSGGPRNSHHLWDGKLCV